MCAVKSGYLIFTVVSCHLCVFMVVFVFVLMLALTMLAVLMVMFVFMFMLALAMLAVFMVVFVFMFMLALAMLAVLMVVFVFMFMLALAMLAVFVVVLMLMVMMLMLVRHYLYLRFDRTGGAIHLLQKFICEFAVDVKPLHGEIQHSRFYPLQFIERLFNFCAAVCAVKIIYLKYLFHRSLSFQKTYEHLLICLIYHISAALSIGSR